MGAAACEPPFASAPIGPAEAFAASQKCARADGRQGPYEMFHVSPTRIDAGATHGRAGMNSFASRAAVAVSAAFLSLGMGGGALAQSSMTFFVTRAFFA
jgi:hypothetical protein